MTMTPETQAAALAELDRILSRPHPLDPPPNRETAAGAAADDGQVTVFADGGRGGSMTFQTRKAMETYRAEHAGDRLGQYWFGPGHAVRRGTPS